MSEKQPKTEAPLEQSKAESKVEAKAKTKQIDNVGLCTWFYVELVGEGYQVLAENQATAVAIVEAHRADKKVQRVGLMKSPPVRGDSVLIQAPQVQLGKTSSAKDVAALKARAVNYIQTGAY